MKKTIKMLCIFIFAFIIFSIGNKVEANSIQSISMDIFVDNKGDAYVTETWKCNVTQGTEVYHPYYNLGKSSIKNLKVTDGSNKYKTESSWNTSGTLSSKAGKCGINKISNGVELCWGISSYGSHTYIAEYTITNFVSETEDAQMIYWTLIPYEFSNSIGKVYIKIHTDFDIADTIDVWGYGNYGGTAYVYDGYIEMQSDGILNTNEYMTILVKFPLGTFNATNKLNHDFDYYFDMAEKGTTKYKSTSVNEEKIIEILITILVFAVPTLIKIRKKHLENVDNKGDLEFGLEGKKIPKDVPYFRDIPCQKDIYRAYYIGYKYGIIKNKTNLLGAIILKWLKDGIIRIEEKETGKIFKKENTVIVLKETNPELLTDPKEKELFNMLYKASFDGYLESREFEAWCKLSYSKILDWFDEILFSEKMKLKNEGLIKVIEKVKYNIFKTKVCVATPELKQEALELAGLKRYLKDYTLIHEREAVEVQLFEEYLIFAQIMGIAKKVAKEFKDLYPEVIEQSHFTSYDYIMFVHTSSYRGISAAQTAKVRAESYSSGGGGFSSGGGGGGSFGGGGGGRRLPLILVAKLFGKHLPKMGRKVIIKIYLQSKTKKRGAIFMQIKITGKELKVTEAINDYVERKMERIAKYFEDAEADVMIKVEKNIQIAEIKVSANGESFRAVTEDKDLYASIDKDIDILEGQIRKAKTKKERMLKDSTLKVLEVEAPVHEVTDEILKTEYYEIKPMTPEDAKLKLQERPTQMFLTFVNVETGKVNVIHKLKDGKNFGLIEPEA